VRAPVNSFEFHTCERTSQVDNLMLSLEALIVTLQKPSYHRLLRGLPGYLILFDTHAFVPQRQYTPREMPSLSVFCDISKHFTATCRIPPASMLFKLYSINGTYRVEPDIFTTDL
jgi:hypothetical protein